MATHILPFAGWDAPPAAATTTVGFLEVKRVARVAVDPPKILAASASSPRSAPRLESPGHRVVEVLGSAAMDGCSNRTPRDRARGGVA